MNILLIVREEIVCLIILVFLIITARYYRMGKDSESFSRLSFYALGHVVFDIITVYTVNNIETVPGWVNVGSHVIFYLFAIMFSYEFFCYTLSLCFTKKSIKKIKGVALVLPALFLIIIPFFSIEYIQGNGTNYSMGMGPVIGYGIAMIYFIGSILIVLINFSRIENHVKVALIPMLLALVCAELLQIFIPELLFTGGACTIITVGFFFSLENPTAVFRHKVDVDALTGVGSRQSFEDDIDKLESRYESLVTKKTNYISIVFCDINNLKEINNTYGHPEGDTYISNIAQILMRNLKTADKIYRMGGDEFMAVYRDTDELTIQVEVAGVHEACKYLSEIQSYKASVAIGYAVSGEEYKTVRDIISIADYNMYQNKIEAKKTRAFKADSYDEINNISGLTDRIFDALAATGDRNYLFINNMETNVTRLSDAAVEYFGLPGKFIFDFGELWCEYIHPDDREAYRTDINALFLGKQEHHDLEYRIKNKDGNYVVVTCRGGILKGKNGEPDLFAGTIVNHGLSEYIDPLTGLHNEVTFLDDVNKLIGDKTPAAIMKISTISFSRINMLYGRSNGDDVLCSFVETVKNNIGERGRLYRLDGIKFVAVLPGMDLMALNAIYERIQEEAQTDIKMKMLSIPVKTAAGAYILTSGFDGTAAQVRNYIMHAHERSKYELNGKLVCFDERYEKSQQLDYNILTLIHSDAVSNQSGFYLKYQPIVNMNSGKICGAEALVRWHNDEMGEIMPNNFIPWLENDPCFFELGKWILKKALCDAMEMLSIIPDFTINVNVTVQQLQNEKFREIVLAALFESEFPSNQLCLELTERCKELDVDVLKEEIDYFHEHKIKVALDDIGTGAASFALIFQLPLDVLKLDKQFVKEILTRKANETFVKMITDTASDLECTVCFEGIENEEIYQNLKKYKDTVYQGYYFAKPMKLEELKKLQEK